MRKITLCTIGLALVLFTGCQPIMPMSVAHQANNNQPVIMESKGIPDPVRCLIDFEATVRQGPSSGVTLQGSFAFKVDETGSLDGTLKLKDQSEIAAVGQVVGRAIHLVFVLEGEQGKEKHIFGVGTAVREITNDTCGDTLGGPFVGPLPGDNGDWLARVEVGDADTPAEREADSVAP